MLAGVMLMAGCVVPDNSPATYYADFQARVQEGGGYRIERSAPDAPFSNADLIRNFELIAFYQEFDPAQDGLVEKRTTTTLSRWAAPVRVRLFGQGVRKADRQTTRDLLARLSKASGLPVTLTQGSDYEVFVGILSPLERTVLSAELAGREDGERFAFVGEWANENAYPCIATIYGNDERPGEIAGALVVIKNELEGILRDSCLHEELTQMMGLLNDHPDVRPSLFNDDEEFAFLTEHDEYLLRILYDPRLRPDMTAEDARPVIPGIVQGLRPHE